MDITHAYRVFADRLFTWASDNFMHEVENDYPILRLVAEPEVQYASDLSVADRRVLYSAIPRMATYFRVRNRNEIDLLAWRHVGGTPEELDLYFDWHRMRFQYWHRWQQSHPMVSVSLRELRAALLDRIRSATGMKGVAQGSQNVFIGSANGWSVSTIVTFNAGPEASMSFVTTIGREDKFFGDWTSHPVVRALPFGPGMGIAFPDVVLAPMGPTNVLKAGDVVEMILSLQWSTVQRLTQGLGPDDPEEPEQLQDQRFAERTPDPGPKLVSSRPPARSEYGEALSRPVPEGGGGPSYDVVFVRAHDELDVDGWLRSCGVRAVVLGTSLGWTAAVVDAGYGALAGRMIESNPGYLLSTRLDTGAGWRFDVFDHSSRVCSFSVDWRAGFAEINSEEVDLDVIDRLSGLAQLDYSFKDMFTATDPVIPLQLKTLEDLLTNPYAWKSYADDITPDMLFAEVLHLPDAVGTDDFEGLTFDRLFREYVDDPDMFRESFPNAKLISP